eukprot:757412-Hanusia_phi.AAC.5
MTLLRGRGDAYFQAPEGSAAHGHGSWVQPLVSELQGGWFLRIFCLLPDCKACAARSLGYLAGQLLPTSSSAALLLSHLRFALPQLSCPSGGSSDYVESMVRAGAVQALMKILRLRYRWLYPTESLLRLKADAAFAVPVSCPTSCGWTTGLANSPLPLLSPYLPPPPWASTLHRLAGSSDSERRRLTAGKAARGRSDPSPRAAVDGNGGRKGLTSHDLTLSL